MKAGAKFCDKCGAPIQQKEKRTTPKIDKRFLYIIASVLGICAVVILFIGVSRLWKNMPSDTDKYLDKEDGKKLVKEEAYISLRIINYDSSYPDYYTEYSYDEAGNLVKIISYDRDGNVHSSYYKHGPEDYSHSGWKEFSYDEDGNLVKETIQYSNGYEKTCSYDNSGNLVKKMRVVKHRDGTINYDNEAIYSYDNLGNLVKEDFPNGTWTTYSYDEDGNLVEEQKYYSDGLKASASRYSYDRNGNLIIEEEGHYFGDEFYAYERKIYFYE